LAGENVLFAKLVKFAHAWDTTHEIPFFCDVISLSVSPLLLRVQADYEFGPDSSFDWADIAKREKGRTRPLTIKFISTQKMQFCQVFSTLEAFQTLISFPVILVGPFGDRYGTHTF
jgi:hypothetical protein